jgi:hypothetical protein
MLLDQLRDVTSPKVSGSINLDKIFYCVDLEFFVLTSSVNSVIANRGQANYAAANSSMCSLATQRRKRGLRAAAVNGRAIIGAGYMERASRRTWDRVAQNNWMMRLSEDDFVQSVCEGIEASRLDGHGPDMSTGLIMSPKESIMHPSGLQTLSSLFSWSLASQFPSTKLMRRRLFMELRHIFKML